MKCSIVIAVLESYEVVWRQLLHFEKVFNNPIIKDDCEIIIVDDGSDPSLHFFLNRLKPELAFNQPGSISGLNLWKLNKGFNLPLLILETNDKDKWTQPRARNKGAIEARGEYLLMTDIDHILTEESILDTIKFKGDKLMFPRKFSVLNEMGELNRERSSLIEYGCKEDDIEKQSCHANTFAMKREIFLEKLHGYDEKFCGKYGGDDTDLNDRYGKLHYAGEVERHETGGLIYVFPDPSKDVKGIFHHLKR